MQKDYKIQFNTLKISSILLYFLVVSCATSRLSKFSDKFEKPPYDTSFHGLVVMEASSGKVLHNTNGDKYFIPASNVKIFTLFASKKMLPQKAPALEYVFDKDTVLIKGTGYPATLHPYFKDSTVISFLKKQKNITFYEKNDEVKRFGPGWAWEDYDTYFSPEINTFPLYGNVLTIYPDINSEVFPNVFLDSIHFQKKSVRRDERTNQFYVKRSQIDTLTIPFITSPSLSQKMLESTLNKKISLSEKFPDVNKQTLLGLETDSIVKRMMYRSDNFLAEQLLLMASSKLSDTLSATKAIAHILENELMDLENPPRWVDGSGLSRYNLIAPESITYVLKRLYDEVPHEELFSLFPSWDRNGTIEVWNNYKEPRYIFAKSGAMGNTYNLSGYLKTKSGKTLIFSCMNNHFRIPTQAVRDEIEFMLKSLWAKY